MAVQSPQSEFTVVLPLTDNATPPNALSAGQMTSLDFQITAGGATTSFPFTLTSAQSVPGSSVTVTFATLGFHPVAGTSYTADVFAVDAGGNGIPSANAAWVQLPAVPAAPTLTVS